MARKNRNRKNGNRGRRGGGSGSNPTADLLQNYRDALASVNSASPEDARAAADALGLAVTAIQALPCVTVASEDDVVAMADLRSQHEFGGDVKIDPKLSAMLHRKARNVGFYVRI